MRRFDLHWNDGTTQFVLTNCAGSKTEACAQAMNEAGIGRGALAALDYWEEAEDKWSPAVTGDILRDQAKDDKSDRARESMDMHADAACEHERAANEQAERRAVRLERTGM
jgi:hypothetical protein